MKSLLKRIVVNDETNEEFNLVATFTMILLFLTFIGATFYLMVES